MPTVEFTIPKNTPKSNVYRQTFDLGVNSRMIKSVEVTIPEGHKGLAYARGFTPGVSLFPESGSSSIYIHGENKSFSFSINKRIEGPPYNLFCEGYNEDLFLPHTFVINIEV